MMSARKAPPAVPPFVKQEGAPPTQAALQAAMDLLRSAGVTVVGTGIEPTDELATDTQTTIQRGRMESLEELISECSQPAALTLQRSATDMSVLAALGMSPECAPENHDTMCRCPCVITAALRLD